MVDKLTGSFLPVLGKVNLDEFAMGSFGDNSAFFQTINPLNASSVPGGSSSGSAASVAAGLACASVGTDTGGSVRIPAAFCGLVGFKPSYGAISRYGLVAYASSLDTVGTITKTVSDAALLSSVLFGRDERDMTSVDISAAYIGKIDLRDITFAFSDNDIKDSEKEIADVTEKVAKFLSDSGSHRIRETVFGNSEMDYAYKVIACAEATSNLARYDGIKYGGAPGLTPDEAREKLFGAEVKRRIDFGNFVLRRENFEKYYEAAQKERKKVIRETGDLFERADIILSPVCDFTPPEYSKVSFCRADRFTVAANFSGVPAISFPVGKDKKGMPVSVQLMSKRYSDARLLAIAGKIEKLLREVDFR